MNNFETFSSWDREENKEERTKLAKEILAKRKRYKTQEDLNKKAEEKLVDVKKEKEKRDTEVYSKIENLNKESLDIFAEIEKTKEVIDQHKKAFLGWMRHKKKIKELETALLELQEKHTEKSKQGKKDLENFENDMDRYVKIREDIQKEIRTDIEWAELLKWKNDLLASRRKSKEGEYLDALEKEEYERSVSRIIAETGTYFLHIFGDIYKKNKTKTKGSMNEGVEMSLDTQLDIVLGLEPSISCSSFQFEEQYKGAKVINEIGSWMGVILADGRVEEALPGDAKTQAKGLWDRKAESLFEARKPNGTFNASTKESIDVALSRNMRHVYSRTKRELSGSQVGSNGYNEFVISRPKVGAIFINYDAMVWEAQNYGEWWVEKRKEVLETADAASKKYNLPLVFLEGDKMIYAESVSDFDNDWGRSVPVAMEGTTQWEKGDYSIPREVAGWNWINAAGINPVQIDRKEIIAKIFSDSPFGYAAESVAHIGKEVSRRDGFKYGSGFREYISQEEWDSDFNAWLYNQAGYEKRNLWKKQKPSTGEVFDFFLEKLKEKEYFFAKNEGENSRLPFLCGLLETMPESERESALQKIRVVYEGDIPDYKKDIEKRFGPDGEIKILPEDYKTLGLTREKQDELGLNTPSQKDIDRLRKSLGISMRRDSGAA